MPDSDRSQSDSSRHDLPPRRPETQAPDTQSTRPLYRDDAEFHRRVKEIFVKACDLDPDQLEVFLFKACGSDKNLREEVDSLLRHHTVESTFLEPIMPNPLIPVDATVLLNPSRLPDSGTNSSFLDQGRFAPGTVLNGRYRITSLLGHGGMGEVYRADDLTLGQTVAMKFLPPELTRNRKWLERFHNEVRMARQISHPNVCRVYDVAVTETIRTSEQRKAVPVADDRLAFLTMEYVDGEDLSSLLRRIGRLQRDKAVEIARQLCAGLAAAHKKGVLHRDLKPTNIMIDGQGHVRITDFGLAAPLTGPNSADIRAGTPAYMAPEQITGKSVSVRSDIYSLGLVLYELFTGKQAFKAKTLREYEHLHNHSQPANPTRLIPDMPDIISRVLMRCLEKDPEQRPASALMVSAALPGGDPLAAALAAGETPSPEMVAASGERGSIHPVIAVSLIVLTVCCTAAILWMSQWTMLTNLVPLELPPQVLADQSRKIISQLGFKESSFESDQAFGFIEDQRFLDYLEHHNGIGETASPWEPLRRGRPSGILFWYRLSPQPLIPTNRTSSVSLSDPPPLVPGMVSILLDPAGRLIAFERIPKESPRGSTSAFESESAAVNWRTPFELAHLDSSGFNSVPPTITPKVYADTLTAWIGQYPENPDFTIRIEAGAFNDQIVYFNVLPPWQEVSTIKAKASVTEQQSRTARYVQSAMFVVALTFGSLLAWRNIQLARGDRQGAFRVAMFIFLAGMVEHIVGATHVPSFLEELTLFGEACGKSLYAATQTWLFYMALEPFVRRLWPDTIISWSRLLRGRFNDPLVGRDILIGCLFATFVMTAWQLMQLLPNYLSMTPIQPLNARMDELPLLMGPRMAIAQLARYQFIAINYPLIFLLVLLLLRVTLRNRWITGLVFVMLCSMPSVFSPNWQVNLPIMVFIWTLAVYILMRFGLVAMIATILVFMLLRNFPLTLDTGAWFAPGGIFALCAIGGLMLYGFAISQTGRGIPTDHWLEQEVLR